MPSLLNNQYLKDFANKWKETLVQVEDTITSIVPVGVEIADHESSLSSSSVEATPNVAEFVGRESQDSLSVEVVPIVSDEVTAKQPGAATKSTATNTKVLPSAPPAASDEATAPIAESSDSTNQDTATNMVLPSAPSHPIEAKQLQTRVLDNAV